MKPLTVLSYNIGHLYIFEPWKHIPLTQLRKIFFNKRDILQIKNIVDKVKPDIIFFQELTSIEDVMFLAENLGFRFSSFSKTNNLKNQNLGTGILYNFDNGQIKSEHNVVDLHSLFIGDCIFTCIHLHPFLKNKRKKQVEEIISFIEKYPKHKHIIGGDFNFSKRINWWVNTTDRSSYNLMSTILKDTTSSLSFTHKLRYKFDYFFTSPVINVKSTYCIHKVYKTMDHYPIILEML